MTSSNDLMDFRYEKKNDDSIQFQIHFTVFFFYFKDQFIDPLALATDRDCIVMSTGVLLLADTIPSLIVKFVAPFLPMYIK